MLKISKAKWLNNADSPCMFMVDDLSNVWIDKNNNGRVDLGEDWGYARDHENSSFTFLNERILKSYEEVKVTFFTSVGTRTLEGKPNFPVYAYPIDVNSESIDFYRSIQFNSRFEIAYHGLNHGILKDGEFIQEWEGFQSIEEAIYQIEKGKEIYYRVFGKYPKGGKYCGYRYNKFSDESINRTGFLWWCRHWDKGDGTSFDLKYFGKVIDLPSTIHGGGFPRLRLFSNWIKWGLKRCSFKKGLKKEIEDLISKRQVISIQEHISPIKVTQKRQIPNIIDDVDNLKFIFDFLKEKNIWYATGTEIAEYFTGFEDSKIVNTKAQSFDLSYEGQVQNPVVTFNIDATNLCNQSNPYIQITLPDGSILGGQQYNYDPVYYRHVVHLPIQQGTYRVEPIASPLEDLTSEINQLGEIRYNRYGWTGKVIAEVNNSLRGYYLYKNGKGDTSFAKWLDNNKLTFFVVNSSKDDRLISID